MSCLFFNIFDYYLISFLLLFSSLFLALFCQWCLKLLAELRTITSLCDSDSDFFIQTYNALHRNSSESSEHSGAPYYSETESQQSVSDRSFYDNVHDHRPYVKARNYLMPPANPLRTANVNRSVSFQDTSGPKQMLLKPRVTKNIVIRRRKSDIKYDFDSNRSSVSRAESSASKSNVDSSITCKSDVQSRIMASNYSIDSKECQSEPFYVRALRRMQKLSFFWQKKRKKVRNRGRLSLKCFFVNYLTKIY